MSGLDHLIGTSFGPFPVPVDADRVAAFAAAIGDDPGRWMVEAPPMFANAALFTAAPRFLDRDDVAVFTKSLLHSEQTYEWSRPLQVGAVLDVTGTVQGVRTRGTLHLVTFGLRARSSDGDWLDGTSVFVMSQDAASAASDEDEPAEDDRPPFDDVSESLPLPEVGEEVGDLRCGASRADLMRYAAASEDWNPIHLDHDAARRAGLGGVIVHGLLMAAWMAGSAGRYGVPVEMRLRFRSPLRPSVPAVVRGVVAARTDERARLDLELVAQEQRLVTARIVVTP